MGWWKSRHFEDAVVGDEPLDVLGAAVTKIAQIYQAEWKRLPSMAEWEAMLTNVLGNEDPTYAVSDTAIDRVSIAARKAEER
jgi:hypothetical protein